MLKNIMKEINKKIIFIIFIVLPFITISVSEAYNCEILIDTSKIYHKEGDFCYLLPVNNFGKLND